MESLINILNFEQEYDRMQTITKIDCFNLQYKLTNYIQTVHFRNGTFSFLVQYVRRDHGFCCFLSIRLDILSKICQRYRMMQSLEDSRKQGGTESSGSFGMPSRTLSFGKQENTLGKDKKNTNKPTLIESDYKKLARVFEVCFFSFALELQD